MRRAGVGGELESTLLSEWKKTGTTGRGEEYLRGRQRREAHIAAMVPRDADVSVELICFLAERLTIPMATKFKSKNTKKEERGKTLNYDKETAEVRQGLDKSRAVEWQKWIQFLAGKPCRGKTCSSY